MALSQSEVDKFLDDSVHDNLKILPDVLKELQKEKNDLSSQLSGLMLQEEGEKEEEVKENWQIVTRDTRTTISELQSLSKRLHSLQEDLSHRPEEREEGFEMKELFPILRDLRDVEQLRKYLQWISKGQQLSQRIESRLRSTLPSETIMEDAVCALNELSILTEKLSASKCINLKEFITSKYEQRKSEVMERLYREFDDLLKTINWPITKESSTKSLKLWQQKEHLFAANFKHLLIINRTETQTQRIPNIDDPIPLPIELLLSPLRKRFKFHFLGDRQTNTKDKPEWFFTQISTWISDHTHFLEAHIQPILRGTAHQYLNAKVEFIRGLLQEVMSKLTHELNPDQNQCILGNDYLMTHLIDELLLFDHELHTVHQYPLLYPSCIVVLLGKGPLCRWLNLERQFAVEKLKVLMESPTAWEPLYVQVLTVDDTRVPECAERMMQLIAGIAERFKHIPSLYVRLLFLELQSDLLLEFHQDITDNVSIVQSLPLSARYSAYLNASHYIASLLSKWGEETFYLELHYSAQQLGTGRFETSPNEDILHRIESLRKLDPHYAQLEGTAFENVVTAFNSLCADMRNGLVQFIAKGVKPFISGYRRERWHNFPSTQDTTDLEISSSLTSFLQKLQAMLQTINTSITPDLLDLIFDSVCENIDQIFLQQVIYSNHFNGSGSIQLHHDITRVIVPILAQFISKVPSHDLLHKSCDVACLISQDTAVLLLLLELSKLALNGDQEAEQEIWTILKAWNIHRLSLAEVSKVVQLRIITT